MKLKFQKIHYLLGCMLITFTGVKAQVGEVIWQEDFNSLKTSVWNVIVGDGTGTPAGAGWGNQELEYYNTSNVYIGDVPGESGNKALVLQAQSQAMGTRSFTSGKVDTYGKLSIKYGMVEMRIRVPNLQTGLWPAAWLLGTSNANWPAKGEIDMMEMGHNITERTRQGFPNAAINNYAGSNLIFYSSSAVSSSNPSGAASTAWDVNYDTPYVSSSPMNDRFVLYRMYWSSTSIRFTVVDGGVEYDMYTSPFTFSSESDEFTNPFYFILNLAVGGSFTDALTNSQVTASMPAKMYIDYIKVSKWNNQGEVTTGGSAKETGTFGVFTDNTATTNKLVAGTSSDIYAWNNLVAGTTAAYEGSNVIAWATSTANTWFGGGIQSRQARNMSNFQSGNLKFRIKIPANVSFKIGMTDTYTNEAYVTFPANTTTYGLTRDGNWGQVTIPISAFSGLLAFQSMNYLFTIVSVDGQLPTSTFQFAIDDIYWEGGGGSVNVAPTVSITSPSSGTSYTAPASVSLAANAADTDGTISKVEFYNGTTLLGTDTSSPYAFSWTNVAAGTYSLTAKATDNSGATTTSSAVSITVKSSTCAATTVTPYTQINDGAWSQTATATLAAGGKVKFGPQPSSGGSWSWSGPNSFAAATREVTISNIQSAQAGTYVATYTNSCGTKTIQNFTITLSSSSGCSINGSTGDFKTTVSNDSDNPTLTFVPITSGAGATTCILYYGTDLNVTFPGYRVTPNTAFKITAAKGKTVYFYYTYSLSTGGERTTLNNKNSFTVGNCSSLKKGTLDNEEISADKIEFEAYPVPMNDWLKLQFKSNTYNKAILVDISGKVLRTQAIEPETEELTMDVRELSKGTYFIKLQGPNAKTGKVIVK
jgi:beta-glucanase (GH16 family)